MDPMLLDVTDALAVWNQNHNNGNQLQIAVASYENEVGPLPDDIAAQVIAVNGQIAAAGSRATSPPITMTRTTSGVAPSMFSPQGLKVGSLLIPWAGVAAVLIFVGAAWYLSKRKH